MPPTARDYTKLLEEIKKAKRASDHLADFVDLMKTNSSSLSTNIDDSCKAIMDAHQNVHSSIDNINSAIFTDLNQLEINDEEIRDAGDKFLLYQNREQILIWSEQQKANHAENSYWWKYWQAIYEYISKKELLTSS